MDSEKIGKLISKLRKERNLTQQELADILGVSPKTISKWECGGGLPDISIIKKIAEELNISVEELLDGSQKIVQRDNNNGVIKKKIILVISLLLIVIVLLIIFVFVFNRDIDREKPVSVDENVCTVIRTYYIDDIGKSNDENYSYITIHEFQVEGVFTVKLPNIEAEKLEVGNSYEFTFNIDKEYVLSVTDVLFDKSEIVDIEYSDKIGLDRISSYYCSK